MNGRLLVLVLLWVPISSSLQTSDKQFNQNAFIEATLCTTGTKIRIPLGPVEDQGPPEQHRACHAICSRDQEGDGNPQTGSNPFV